jgi:calcineurin-like phosphoesterase family protein
MKTWWTSDTHFSHENIISLARRPFLDIEEMNTALISAWNALVAPEDVVWHLGDLAMGNRIVDQIALTSQLNGIKRLVPGNHDRVSSTFDGGAQRERFLSVYQEAGWDIYPEVLSHEIGGFKVVVSHFPYTGESSDQPDRYLSARPNDEGLPIIHGHVHGTFSERGRQFNVGVDVRDFAPVAESAIIAWLRTSCGQGPDPMANLETRVSH